MNQSLSMYITLLKKDFDSFCNFHLQQMGLSQGLLFFLIYIGNHPNCSPKELSLAIKADTGHTTRCVEKLVQGGFVLRQTKETDKRAFQLQLTEKGTEAFTKIKSLFNQWDHIILKDIPKEDIENLFKTFSNLRKTSGTFTENPCNLTNNRSQKD